MHDACRLCLGLGANENIFENEGLLTSRIVLCCRLEPEINDGLPAVICKTCHVNLNHIWNFQMICHDSDRKLRTLSMASLNSIKAVADVSIKVEIETEPDIYTDEDMMENDVIDIEDVKIEPQYTEELSKNVGISSKDISANSTRKSGKCVKFKDCTVCGKSVAMSRMSAHLKSHGKLSESNQNNIELSKSKHVCSYCSKTFDLKSEVEEHIILQHLLSEYRHKRIEENKRRVEERRNLIKIKNKKLGKAKRRPLKFECDYCSKKVVCKSRLELHIKTNHLYSGKCGICSRIVSYNTLSKHLKYHEEKGPKPRHERRLYVCSVCSQRFTQILTLMMHLNAKHPNRDDLACPACDSKVPASDMVKHAMMHEELLKSCHKCNMKFFKSTELNKHMLTHAIKGPDGPRFACGQCDKLMGSLKSLRQHTNKMHRSPYKRKCDVCNRYLSSKLSFANHMKLHTGAADYECDYCHQKFVRRQTLMIHIMNHINYRPYGCKTCSQAFTSQANLREHEMLHTGEKPFLCSVCGKAFTQRGNMKSHMRHNHKELGKT